MRFFKSRSLALLTAASLAGCSASSVSTPGRLATGLETSTAFQTDSSAYTLRATGNGYEGRIGIRFTNAASDTAFFVNCHGGTGVVLQKLVSDEWKNAWSPALLSCLSPPIAVAPAGHYDTVIHVFGGYPGSNSHPQFSIADIPGVYRAVYTSVVSKYQTDSPFGTPLPEEHRVSNTFEIAVQARSGG